jgi:beta-glucosidase/6-phospho-beta-glucosidase/beta-galactosidase
VSGRLFRSFFLGGFECSSHRLACGRRLDMVAATGHDRHVTSDYLRLREQGIRAAREGLRWPLVEPSPGRYDFASVLPILRAARGTGVEIIWDLFHYGWPDDIDIFSPEFVRRLGLLARAFARVLDGEGDDVPWLVPVNEISFLAWTGGEVGRLNPFAVSRGLELKRQLVRAAIEAIELAWAVVPSARIVHVDPIFHVVAHPDRPHEADAAEAYRRVQYQALDMLCGREEPELGGDPRYLDVIGVNYYPWNQWNYNGPTEDGTTIGPSDRGYRPFRDMLREHHERYGRPLLIAETGTEGDARAEWLRHVGREVRAAIWRGVPVEGICLYPIVNFPGWDDERHCHNGLWDYPDEAGHRDIHRPLAIELRRQRRRIERMGRAGALRLGASRS